MTSPTRQAGPPSDGASAEAPSVLARVLAILDRVEDSDGAVSITELATGARMPKSTVSRLVAALVEQRYLERTEAGISLGIRLFELGARTLLPQRLRAAAAPIIRELGELSGERIGLWMQHDSEMVAIAAVPGRLPMLPTRAGMRSPALTTASGKAFLAFSDEEIVAQLSSSLLDQDIDRFRSELGEVRASGIASDDGVAYPGILAFAAPIMSGGPVVGALSIAGPHGSMDVGRAGSLVRAAGEDLTRRLSAA